MTSLAADWWTAEEESGDSERGEFGLMDGYVSVQRVGNIGALPKMGPRQIGPSPIELGTDKRISITWHFLGVILKGAVFQAE